MKKRIIRLVNNPYFPFLILFISCILIHWNVQIHQGDDVDGLRRYEDIRNLIPTIKLHYMGWSGRVSTMLVSAICYRKDLIVWKILNCILIVVMAFNISKLCINDKNNTENWIKYRNNLMISCLIFLIPLSVFSSGALWASGSLSYLWPISLGLIPIVYYKRELTGEVNSKKGYFFAIVGAVYASYVEQMAAVIIAFSLIIFIYMFLKKIYINMKSFVLFGVVVINSMISILAPGNRVRYNVELIKWYPDFDMLTIFDKLFYGLNYFYDHLFNSATVLFFVLSGLIFIILIIKKKEKSIIFLGLIPLGYCVGRILTINDLFIRLFLGTSVFGNNLLRLLQKIYTYKVESNVYNFLQYIPAFLATIICILMIFLIFEVLSSEEYKLFTVLLLCAAICASLVLSLSPTLYASGDRIFFFTDVLLVSVTSIVFNEYLLNIKRDDKLNIFIIGTILSVSLVLVCGYVFLFSGMQILSH